MSGEFERIARIRQRLERPSRDVLVGIGDDCAVLAPSPRERVWTVDAAVEGVHFARPLLSLEQIGYRAFMAAASDVAAMGCRGVAALSSLVLPSALSDAELDALVAGLAQAADACACPIIGGNLARGAELSLTTTVLGEAHTRVLTRSGARPGDAIYVTGPMGASALGLEALKRNVVDDARFDLARRAFVAPRARLDLAARIAMLATSAIDVSDGLAQDLGHLCTASHVTARITLADVPRVAGFDAGCAALSLDAARLLLAGGEEYELLFTAAPTSVPSELATCIGTIEAGASRVLVILPDGAVVEPRAGGFDHFRDRAP